MMEYSPYGVFLIDDLWPTLEARSMVSFVCGLYDNNVLSTVSSDSEDLMVEYGSSLPPRNAIPHLINNY